jgi:hypothetical protein
MLSDEGILPWKLSTKDAQKIFEVLVPAYVAFAKVHRVFSY